MPWIGIVWVGPAGASLTNGVTCTPCAGWAGVFVPIILAYTSWGFYVMRGKVKAEHVESNPHAY